MKTRVLFLSMILLGATTLGVSAQQQQQQPKGKANVVKTVPKNAKSSTVKGVKYQYADGKYYRQVSGGFEEVNTPPVGIQIEKVPAGYTQKEHKGAKYYYKDDVYYKEVKPNKFEVVSKPW